MGRHWGGVHDELHQAHPVRDLKVLPKTDELDQDHHGNGIDQTSAQTQNGENVPSLVGKALRNEHATPVDQNHKANGTGLGFLAEEEPRNDYHSDSDDGHDHIRSVPTEPSQKERQMMIMRRVMRKWLRLAGLHGHSKLVDELGEEFSVHWTKVGNPRSYLNVSILILPVSLQCVTPRVEGRIRIKGQDDP